MSYIKPILQFRDELRSRYSYDPTHPLVFRWRNISQGYEGKLKIGDIAGYYTGSGKQRRRDVYVTGNRAIRLARAVWVYVNGSEPPPYLKPNPTNPEDYRIENLIVMPRSKQSPEERRASNAAHAARWRNSFTKEEWTQHQKRRNLQVTYKITLETYDLLLMAQGGVCAICHEPETLVRRGNVQPLSVDHCHNGRGVRGLLCTSCNNGLGRFKDDPQRLRRAAEYLEAHGLSPGEG